MTLLQKNLAVIPARGGSKRIPRKNIKNFCGKPMIGWAIEAAKASNLFEKIIVSTDDDEIADIAIMFGAVVPFKRPVSLADDITPTVPVIAHAIAACDSLGWSFDNVCCIYPCSPLIEQADLVSAYSLLINGGHDYVYPVTEYAHPIQRSMRKDSNGKMEFLFSNHELTRTQDLEVTYHDAGQFYWGKASAWLEGKRMHTSGIGMPIPNWRVVDIDCLEDWHRAELIYGKLIYK